MTDPTTQELKLQQHEREREERAKGAGAPTTAGARAAARRADKAAYLQEKLEEQEAADAATGHPGQ